MSTTQGIKLEESTRQRLRALGELRQRSPHWLMRTAIERFLDQEELYEREKKEDMQRWETYQLTGRAISNEEATQWLSALGRDEERECPK